ncbi:hypothetical protein DVV97_08345 [Clostridium botulinum]|nr:hypothetical protein [Clostridium botulinum]
MKNIDWKTVVASILISNITVYIIINRKLCKYIKLLEKQNEILFNNIKEITVKTIKNFIGK